MPIILGYMIGKMIGNLLVAIVTLVFRVLNVLLIIVGRILRCAFKGARWFLGQLWAEWSEWYENYKLRKINI